MTYLLMLIIGTERVLQQNYFCVLTFYIVNIVILLVEMCHIITLLFEIFNLVEFGIKA